MTGLVIGLVVLAGVAVLVVLPFLLSHLLYRVFGRTSGLNRLAERYPAPPQPAGEAHRKEWVAVGKVYYRRDADIWLTAEGLRLWVRPFLGKYAPALIPWSEFRDPQPTVLALRPAVRLSVGNPLLITTVTFSRQFYEQLEPYLSR